MTDQTHAGDQGMSSTDGRTLRRKDSEIFEALGSLDELVAILGWLSVVVAPAYRRFIVSWQHMAMDISRHIAGKDNPADAEALVSMIENHITVLDPPPLRTFVVPGGSEASTRAHVARTVCRRAERRVLTAMSPSHPTLPLLNRLSDALFALACVTETTPT